MIGYITLGTDDMPRAAAFYDRLLGALGATRTMESGRFIFWGTRPEATALGIIAPFDGEPACVSNGGMVALYADSPAKVDEIYRLALELGATDDGPAGPRGPNFYAGYFRDPDGHKLNVFSMT